MTLKPKANSIDAYPTITVEDNDRIVIPHRPSTVSVVGMVYNSGSFVLQPAAQGWRLPEDWRAREGRMRICSHAFVLRADGTVVPSKSVNGVLAGDKFASSAPVSWGPDCGAEQDSNRSLHARTA